MTDTGRVQLGISGASVVGVTIGDGGMEGPASAPCAVFQWLLRLLFH